MQIARAFAFGALLMTGCASQPAYQPSAEIDQAAALFKSCRYDEAEQLLGRFLPAAAPQDAAIGKLLLADLHWRRGDLPTATSLLRDAIASRQFNAQSEIEAEQSLAKALTLQGQYPQAVVEYKKALGLLPALLREGTPYDLHQSSYPVFAAALAESGNSAEALALIDYAMEKSSQSPILRQLKAAIAAPQPRQTGQLVKLLFGDDLTITPGNVDMELSPIRKVAPRYPSIAVSERMEGDVTIEFVVAEDGAVQDVQVLESHPAHVFEGAALEAAWQWLFEPRIRECRAIKARGVQKFVFRVEER